jgi:hypothetical protein
LAAAPPVAVSGAALRGLAGVWRNVERGEVRRTRLKGDTLFADGAERTPIVPLAGGRFRSGRATEIRFEGGSSAPSMLLVRTASGTVTFSRADSAALDPAKLAEYAGDYRSDEVDATHSWKVEKGQLVVYSGYRRLGELEPSYRDGFTRRGSVIDVVRDGRGRITGYLVESGRVRHLRFTRVR